MRRLSRFLLRYAVPYWHWYLLGLVTLYLTNWLAVEIPLHMAQAIDSLATDTDVVRQQALLIAGMGLAVIAVRTLSRVAFFTPGRLVEFTLKNDLFDRMTKLQPRFYATVGAGDIISRATNDITYLRALVGFGGLQVVNVVLALSLTGRKMLQLSPRLTLLTLIPIAIGLILVQFGILALHSMTRRSQRQLSTLSDTILSMLHGVQTIQDFNAQPAFLGLFDGHNRALVRTNVQMSWLRSTVLPVLGVMGSSCIYVLLAVGGPMALSGEISVGTLVAFVTFIAQLIWPLMSLGWLLSVFQRGMNSLERIDELLYAVPDRPEGDDPTALANTPPALSVQNLTFTYPDGDEPVLFDVSVEIPAGSRVGFYGRTGSGKSTLVKVLTRSWNPPEGTVFVDSVDLTHVDLNDWRRRMAVAPQVAFLFSDSIANNVTLGAPAQPGLDRAVARASLTDDVASLPDGLDTVVGERGIMLSGGQRQRTALARALFRDAPLLVLDDVLSAVDQETEQALIDGLEQSQGPRPTTLLVSHRMSALARMDKIVVLEDGRVVDQGTHAELIERPGPYLQAWERQKEEVSA